LSYDLDWLQEIVLHPITVDPSPGQLDLGLVVERQSDWCLCGGIIVVDDDGDVMEAVARHMQTNRHREWVVLGGLFLPTDPEMFGRIPIEIG
jgi:hypothetical protein